MSKLFIVLSLVIFSCNVSFAQISEEDIKIAAPGPQHERLKLLEGEWTSSMSYFMAPGQPMVGSGTSSNKMILGGRFLEMKGVGEVMGTRTESLSILGYDNGKQKYTLVSYDELGTYYVTGEGDYDEITKTITLPGTYKDPKTMTDMVYKFVFDLSDPNAVKFAVIFNMPEFGGEFKMVDGTLKKQ